MSDHPPRPRVAAVRMTFVDNSVTCDACGARMPPGTIVVATSVGEPCDPARLTHDGRCPAPWTPTVVPGGRSVAARPLRRRAKGQLSLFVAEVEEP